MIDFVALVGRITGKAPADGAQPVGAGQALGAESGIPIGGEFAALVRLAAQAEANSAQTRPRLVVDNGGAIEIAQLAAPTLPIDPPIDAAPGEGETELGGKDKPEEERTSSDGAIAQAQAPAAAPLPSPAAAIAPLGQSAVPAPTLPRSADQRPAPASIAQPGVEAVASLPVPAATQAGAGQKVTDVAQQIAPAVQQDLPREAAFLAVRQAASRPQGMAATDRKTAPAEPVVAAAIGMIQPEEAEQAAGVKSANVSTPRLAETAPGVPASSPLRTIVEGLPPVVQSQLSDPAVRAVTGPSTGEALGDHVIDMGVSGQWIDRMAREIAGLVDGSGHSRFTLSPPHLGRLQVDLWRDQDATNVRLTTETDEAAQRLADGRPALQADARIAALAFGSITVEKGASSSFDMNRDQSQNQGQQRDLSGQMQQQADSQAQARRGNAQSGDWMSRSARNDQTETSDAPARPSAERTANGRIRFA